MIYKGDFALQLAIYHLAQMSVTLSYLYWYVVEYLLFVFHQLTPLDLAARWQHEAVMSDLKRALNPNMLEVSKWDCTIEDSCGVKWRSINTNRNIIAAICFTCESFTHASSLNWPWWLKSTYPPLMHEVELLYMQKFRWGGLGTNFVFIVWISKQATGSNESLMCELKGG